MSERRIFVRTAEVVAEQGDAVLVTLGLGPCVAVAVYDRAHHVGGVAHAMLPSPASGPRGATPERFVSRAVPLLLRRVAERGAEPSSLEAYVVGGATMFASLVTAPTLLSLGMRNVKAARTALRRAHVPIVAEDVGGEHGRSLRFHLADGRLLVDTLETRDVVLG